MTRCAIINCHRQRVEGSVMCLPHREWAYRFLANPRWRDETPPPLRRDGSVQLPLEVRE